MPDLIDTFAAEMGFTYEFRALPSTGIEYALQGPMGALFPEMMRSSFPAPGGSVNVSIINMVDKVRGCNTVPVEPSTALGGPCVHDERHSFWDMMGVGTHANLSLTPPFYTSRYSGIVKVEASQSDGLGRIFDPFAPDLWVGVITYFAIIAVLLSVVELFAPSRRGPKRTPGEVLFDFGRNTTSGFYHTAVACFGGDDYEWGSAWPQRLLKLSLLLFALVLVSTYTANLASFFTASGFTISGPTNAAEATRATACVKHKFMMEPTLQVRAATEPTPHSACLPLTPSHPPSPTTAILRQQA